MGLKIKSEPSRRMPTGIPGFDAIAEGRLLAPSSVAALGVEAPHG